MKKLTITVRVSDTCHKALVVTCENFDDETEDMIRNMLEGNFNSFEEAMDLIAIEDAVSEVTYSADGVNHETEIEVEDIVITEV